MPICLAASLYSYSMIRKHKNVLLCIALKMSAFADIELIFANMRDIIKRYDVCVIRTARIYFIS